MGSGFRGKQRCLCLQQLSIFCCIFLHRFQTQMQNLLHMMNSTPWVVFAFARAATHKRSSSLMNKFPKVLWWSSGRTWTDFTTKVQMSRREWSWDWTSERMEFVAAMLGPERVTCRKMPQGTRSHHAGGNKWQPWFAQSSCCRPVCTRNLQILWVDQLLRSLPSKASILASWIHDYLSKDGPMGEVSPFSDVFIILSYYMDCLSLFVWILVFDSNSIWHECIGPTHLLIQNDAWLLIWVYRG